MKEMLQSKILMGFALFVLSFTYLTVISADNTNVVLENDSKIESELVLK